MYVDDPKAPGQMKAAFMTIAGCILVSVVVSTFGYSVLKLNVITCAALAGLANGWAAIYLLPWAKKKFGTQ